MIDVEVTGAVADEGSIIVLYGVTDAGKVITFGCDHRMARPILADLASGETPVALVEEWQILGGM